MPSKVLVITAARDKMSALHAPTIPATPARQAPTPTPPHFEAPRLD